MGELFRRYWHPILLSSDLPQPDAPPVKVTLLSENLVAFRDSRGRVGLLEEACPHRGLPLSNGVNATDRLTCTYHRWAFDVTGACVDELPGADQWRAKAYPTLESAGMIWTYMGPPEEQPPSPSFIANVLPPEHVVATRASVRSTYLKAVEGQIRVAYPCAEYRDATIGVQDTTYGFRLMMRRPARGENRHIDIAHHVLPGCTFLALPGAPGGMMLTVPVDTWSSIRFAVAFNLDRPFTAAEREATVSRSAQMASAQPPIQYGGVADLTATNGASGREHLSPAETAVSRLRQMLETCARDLQVGIDPPGTGGVEIPFHTIPSEQITFGLNDEPRSVAVG